MKTKPQYLAPSAMPHKATKAAQLLHHIKQSTLLASGALIDAAANLNKFDALPAQEKEAAVKALEAGELLNLSKALIAATKSVKEKF